jgi:hypothetical protein
MTKSPGNPGNAKFSLFFDETRIEFMFHQVTEAAAFHRRFDGSQRLKTAPPQIIG